MQGRVSWHLLLLMTVAFDVRLVLAQASDRRPPALFVTRLQEPATERLGAEPGAPLRLQPLPATTIDERQPATNLDGPRRISLNVPRPMPLADLLLLLVNGTPFSLVDGEAVIGVTFVGDLKDLTMRQAIEAVLFPHALDYDVQGTLIRVFPRRTSTRLFNVNYLNARRRLRREVRSSSTSADATGSTAILSSSAESDLLDELEKGLQALLSSSGRMHVDRTAGLVQVTDFADRLDQVGVYLEMAQLRAARQVRIDAQVFEVALGAGGASSIDWNASAIRRATAVRPMTGAASSNVASTDIDALKRAIAQQGVITPIASPQLITMNNEPTIMRFGNFESSANRQVEGLTLAVVAQIAADGVVQMHVSPSYASRAGRSQVSDLVRVNETDTLVRVQDGETVVFSGFLNEREQAGLAVPAPPNQASQTVRSELVILLTPTIIRSAGLPR